MCVCVCKIFVRVFRSSCGWPTVDNGVFVYYYVYAYVVYLCIIVYVCGIRTAIVMCVARRAGGGAEGLRGTLEGVK